MNADDVFHYGHLTVLGAVEGFPRRAVGDAGVWVLVGEGRDRPSRVVSLAT